MCYNIKMNNNEFVIKMKKASSILANIFDDLYVYIQKSDKVTTNDIDQFCYEKMSQYQCVSAAYQYEGEICKFPKYTCISINDEVCHGIPTNRIINRGDIVSVDICIKYDNHFADSCVTFIYKQANSELDIKLLQTSYHTMMSTIDLIKPNIELGLLCNNMYQYAKKHKYEIIREFAGHFIGKKLHLEPLIPFYKCGDMKYKLQINDCFTIEPMIIEKNNTIEIDADGWTARSAYGHKSSQFEHTICVTNNGYEILTKNNINENFVW